MSIMDMLPKGNTLQIPLDAPTAFAATAGNAQVELTWTDPADKYATPEGEVSETGDQLVSEWSHTVLVRKTGSQPAGPDDGTVVVSSSVRDQYKTSAYVDSNLTNDTLYYYGVFSYNKDGVASSGAFTSATPKAGTPLSELTEGTIIKINENGSPVEFYLAKHNYESALNGNGRELVVRKDCYDQRMWNDVNSNTYLGSDLDTWFNGTYKSLLSPSVQQMAGTTRIVCYGVGNALRAVFALSYTELGNAPRNYAPEEGTALPNVSSLVCNGNQWTRSPNTAGDGAWFCNSVGVQLGRASTWNKYGSRPCFTLPDSAMVDVQMNLREDTL